MRRARAQKVRIGGRLERFLTSRNTCRVASIGEDGLPHLVPVGYLYQDGPIYIATDSRSVKVQSLRRNPQCSVLIGLKRKTDAKGVMLGGRGQVRTGKAFLELKNRIESISGWNLDK